MDLQARARVRSLNSFVHFFFLCICSPLAYSDPLHCNMNRLFLMLLVDSLTEYAYDAELAGLKYQLNVSIYGISVSISFLNNWTADSFSRKLHSKVVYI